MTASAIVTMLFATLWQGTVIGLVAWLTLACAHRASAATRHAILWCAFIAVAAIPIALTLSSISVTTTPSVVANGGPRARAASVSLAATPAHSTSSSLPTNTPRRITIVTGNLSIAIVIAWLLGAGFVLGKLTISLARLAQIRRRALPLYRRNEVPVCTSQDIAVPIAVGFWRPVVILPARLAEELSPSDRDCIVLHEIAHIRRGDAWAKVVQLAIEAIWFFNPALRILGRRIAIEREIACDDRVIAQCFDRNTYARCLVDLAERVSLAPAGALGVLGSPNSTRVRVRQQLDARHNGEILTSRYLVASALALFIATALVLKVSSPIIAFAASTVAQTHARPPIVPPAVMTDAKAPSLTVTASPAPTIVPRAPRSPAPITHRAATIAATACARAPEIPNCKPTSYSDPLRAGFSSTSDSHTPAPTAAPSTLAIASIPTVTASPFVQPTAAATALPTSCTKPAKLKTVVYPVMPSEAYASMQNDGIDSVSATVRVDVGADGQATGASVTPLTVYPGLNLALKDAALDSTYTPALANCVPVAGSTLYRVVFGNTSYIYPQ